MLINFVCVIALIAWLYVVIKKKNITHPMTFILFGIFLPLFLYNLNWSELIDTSNCFEFDYLILIFLLLTLLFFFYSKSIKTRNIDSYQQIKITHFGKKAVMLITFFWIFCYLFENYWETGTFFPALYGIDAHKTSKPIISYFTNSSFIVTSINYIAFKSTKKKRHLLYVAICIILPVISRSSRMAAMVTALQTICLMLVLKNPITSIKQKRKRKFTLLLSCIVFCGLVAYMALLTNYRMNHYGKYDLDYGNTIMYNGPDLFGILEVYYGYFPMSFNNLKINLLYNTSVHHNYFGLYSFTSLWFGIFQFDNLLGFSSNGYIVDRIVSSNAATVATGFWVYWYDFGFFAFIPLIIAFLITIFIQKKAEKENRKLTYRVLYAWFIPFWFFTSFQNILFQATNIVVFIILYNMIGRIFYVTSVPHLKKTNDI